MAGAKRLPAYSGVQLPAWYYIGGETLVTPNSQALGVPSTADTITISAETGACYYNINGGNATTLSPGYIATGAVQTLERIANLTGVYVHSPSGTIHVQYWRQA